MSFDLAESKPSGDMYFESKHVQSASAEDDYPNSLGVHKDLFETLSEAHYLPELAGPHDEALLDSLVEKGCEDNQILGQALDKLAHLVHGANDYAEEEDDMLLGGAPVADIIDRLEQSLESPGRNSITAAQGLLHLHHIGDHLQSELHNDQTFVNNEVYAQEPHPPECDMNINPVSELHDMDSGNLSYTGEQRLQDDVGVVMYTDVPESRETYSDRSGEPQEQPLPDQSEHQVSSGMPNNVSELSDQIKDKFESNVVSESDQRTEIVPEAVDFSKEMDEPVSNDDLEPTDLSVKHVEKSTTLVVATAAETTNLLEDNMSEKSDEQPKDLTVHRRLPSPHSSPRRIEIPRPPSRESDAMQSPQPSGIPAVPSSPELFTMPSTKSKQTLFLESLLSSPSPKMYTSEVTITKQPCEPINLGKHRKSASPTVSSCSDDMRKLNKEYGEPQDKRVKRESVDDLIKISKVFSKSSDDQISDTKQKKPERHLKSSDETSPLKQLQVLKTSPEFNIPDPLLVPKDKLNLILAAPGREIPALLIQRPELRLPEAFAFPTILQDPDILVISLSQLENILENDAKKLSSKSKDNKSPGLKGSSSDSKNSCQSDQNTHPKPIPSIDALAGDIDAATSAAFNQMLWLPYLSQLEAMAACSQNMDFLKALNSSGYTGSGYPDLSQMFNPAANRFMNSSGFPMMPPMEYDNRLQLAMWQEAMNQTNSQRSKSNSMEAHMKELSKSNDLQNPYVHSTKSHQSKPQSSSARTSPLVHNYGNQRSMNPNPFFAGMYPGMNPNMRPNVPLPGLQIPYLNPNLMNSQRSPRNAQQKSPTSPYYPNNNYLQSLKQSSIESHSRQRSTSTSSQDSPKPRISVKSLQNLMEPGASGASSRRPSQPSAGASSRRREEGEVGSTTPGEPPHLPPLPHDPSSFHLWHPLFGNQKGYNSPWSWTTVTATGD